MTYKIKEVMFYQNNPCLIVRDVNESFCEIQLNIHFAANIEAEHYCTPSEFRSPMSSGQLAQEEYDQAQAILDDIQDEEHSIICMVEKRLLNDSPIESTTIKSLQRCIDDNKYELEKTKSLHEEWMKSAKGFESKVCALKSEVESLNLSLNSVLKDRDNAENGIDNLMGEYNKIMVQIGYGNKKITISEYDEMIKRDELLTALENGGVDNWEWYEESITNYNKGDKS